MIRALPLLVLASCSVFQKPVNFTDAVCLGVAGYSTATGIAAQLDGDTIPGGTLDLRECIDLTIPPTTCEEQAKRDAWVEWSASFAVAANAAADGAINNGEAMIAWPAVEIATCP